MPDTHAPKPYKPTLFDRHGADAGSIVRAFAFSLMGFGLAIPLFAALAMKLGLGVVGSLALVAGGSLGTGLIAFVVSVSLGNMAGGWYKRLMVDGASTPYVEQYSYQQALVMRGQLAEALESFEAVIAEKPDAVGARLRAAELYARDANRPDRAAELFREAQRIPTITVGDEVYVANRLVDLYLGPLNAPGRALVELRRLIDRHPDSAAAQMARDSLAKLKEVHVTS